MGVLECGMGVSTVDIAHAMMENRIEGNGVGRMNRFRISKNIYCS